jgi:hypothetical protein
VNLETKGVITMKQISTILLTVAVLFWGCEPSNDQIVNVPDNISSPALFLNVNCELIPLPEKSPLWIDSLLTMSKEIDGSVGGKMLMQKYYISDTGDSIFIKVDLTIPAGAFNGNKLISMTVDSEYAVVHFSPEMIFVDTLRLFQAFEGLNLEEYPTGTIDFVYVNTNGTVELIKKNGMQVVVPQGIVRVQNAKLLHFSRYGWIKKFDGVN